MRRLFFLLPVALFLAVGVALAWGLTRDPSERSSPLEGRPAPAFALPPLPERGAGTGLKTADLQGAPSLVNVFASWCAPCRIEHPLLAELARDGVTVNGIDYKDTAEDARAFLNQLGDPYDRIGFDDEGRAGIDWGITGVPETFVVDAKGEVVHRHVGPLTPRDVEETIRPLLEDLAS